MIAELYVIAGIVLIGLSTAGLAVAQTARSWFFLPDLRDEVRRQVER
jgi:hypothetical protein